MAYNLALAGTVGTFGVFDGDSALQTAASNYSNTVTISQQSVDRPNDPFTLSLPDYYIEVDVDLNSFVTGTQSSDGDDADNNLDDVFGIKGFSIDSSATAGGEQAENASGYWQFKGAAGADTTKIAQAATITFEADSNDSDISVTGSNGSANTVLLVNYNVASSTGEITVGVNSLVHNDSGNGTITTTIVDNLQKQQFWKATQADVDNLAGVSTGNDNVIYPELGQTGNSWDTSAINTTAPTTGAGNDIAGLGDDSISVPASFYTDASLHSDFSDDLVGELVANKQSAGSKDSFLQVVNSFSFTLNGSDVASDGDPNNTPDARHNQLSEFARYKVANGDSNSSTSPRSAAEVNTQLVTNMPANDSVNPNVGFPLFNDGDFVIICAAEEAADAEGQELNTGLELGDSGTTAATAVTSAVSVLVPSALTGANGPITANQENADQGEEGEVLFSANVGIVLKQVANWTLQDGSYALPDQTPAWVYDANSDAAVWQAE